MGIARTIALLMTVAVLIGAVAPAHAHESAAQCDASPAGEARALAEDARRRGDYRQAAACYLRAGEPMEADRVLAKAFASSTAATSRKASLTIEEAKSQARRMRAAFQPAARTR
jgi:hypothetical protein